MEDILECRVKVSPEVLCQEIEGESVFLDLKSESYFGLDEVGTRIWQLLQEKEGLQSVFDTLLQEYDVEPQQLKADLDDLLAKLSESGLVSLEPV